MSYSFITAVGVRGIPLVGIAMDTLTRQRLKPGAKRDYRYHYMVPIVGYTTTGTHTVTPQLPITRR